MYVTKYILEKKNATSFAFTQCRFCDVDVSIQRGQVKIFIAEDSVDIIGDNSSEYYDYDIMYLGAWWLQIMWSVELKLHCESAMDNMICHCPNIFSSVSCVIVKKSIV